MRIARLQHSDAAQYRSLMREAYTLAPDAFTSTVEERESAPESFWIGRIADATGRNGVFGAFDGRQLAGTVGLECHAREKTRHKARVISMYVVPAARGAGVGRALLEAAVAHARGLGSLAVLTLSVTEGNAPARKLYASAGFQVRGVEPMAILTPGGFKAKVYMSLPLSHDAGTCWFPGAGEAEG